MPKNDDFFWMASKTVMTSRREAAEIIETLLQAVGNVQRRDLQRRECDPDGLI